VNGRNALSHEQRFALDVWYVDNWTLGLDLKILLMTAFRAFSGQGISSAEHATMPKYTGDKPGRCAA
jgi:sugar transferase EpsL